MVEDLLMPRMLTVEEVASILRVSEVTIYRRIQAGELPAFKIGAVWRIDVGDLEAYVRAQKTRNSHSHALDG